MNDVTNTPVFNQALAFYLTMFVMYTVATFFFLLLMYLIIKELINQRRRKTLIIEPLV